VGLIHAKTQKPDISKAIHDAMARRIVSMIHRIGVNEDVVMIGGVGRNPGFMEAMKRELNLEKIHVPEAPEYGAAVGAAVVAAEEWGHG
jgi:benzoyl-CoA reductase subunit D